MSTLRKLSAMYLLCALSFSVAVLLDRNPPLERASKTLVRVAFDAIRQNLVEPGMHLAGEGANHLIAVINQPAAPPFRLAGVSKPVQRHALPAHLARAIVRPAHPMLQVEPTVALRNLPEENLPDLQVAGAAPPPTVPTAPGGERKPIITLAPPSVAPAPAIDRAQAGLAPAELVRVTSRLRENLTREMVDNFSLFLYVSKADAGPWAQRMYVFRKDARGNLAILYNWPASTGREKFEIAPNGTHQHSITPAGYYELDAARMYLKHFSGQWHEPMPYAMFFNWENHGYRTGMAIHAATPVELSQLGSRASAGCIRVAPENAQLLFGLIRAEYKGLAPRFAFNRRTATMSNNGVLMHDPAGNLQLAQGYKVLVFIENYGGENVVAALF